MTFDFKDGKEIWYREELAVLCELVTQAIGQANQADTLSMIALGHLHLKLQAAINVAPTGDTTEATP